MAQVSGSGHFVLGAGLACLLIGLKELNRLGSFAGRELGWVLLPAAVVVLGRLGLPDDLGAHVPTGRLYVEVGLTALAAWLLVQLFRGRSPRAAGALAAVAFALWLVPPLPLLERVWTVFGQRGLISLLILSKLGDTAGYYVGSAIGRSHPFPAISPGKTTAGCVASLVAGTLAGGVLVATGMLAEARWGVAGGLVAGALVNLAAQGGDLLESSVKRHAGVKDSSSWFGPAGGMLDLVDSLLLSVPVALATWPWLFAGA